jgi:hypothetical protein
MLLETENDIFMPALRADMQVILSVRVSVLREANV